jgi:hypothetical protein
MGRTPFSSDKEYSETTKKLQVKNVDYTHRQIALMVALGWSTKRIAEDMGLQTSRVSVIKTSPALQPYIEEYRRRFEEKAIAESIVIRTQEEFHKSMDKLAELRDDSPKDEIVLGAAKFLAEKAIDVTVPKKTITEESKKVGVVIFQGDDIKRLLAIAEEEDEAILVEAGDDNGS